MTSQELFYWAYGHGYNGAWSWSAIGSDESSDSLTTQKKGMKVLRKKKNQDKGGTVRINIRNKGRRDQLSRLKSAAADVFRGAISKTLGF